MTDAEFAERIAAVERALDQRGYLYLRPGGWEGATPDGISRAKETLYRVVAFLCDRRTLSIHHGEDGSITVLDQGVSGSN